LSAPGLVIVGGSYAALQVAASAREFGYRDSIFVISEEDTPPYHRPPLTKGFLSGKTPEEDLLLRAPGFYREQKIDLVTGRRVRRIDREGRWIECDDSTSLGYSQLALCTGARARCLPAVENLEGVFTIRNLDDSKRLRAKLVEAKAVVILGGGFIGLEAAAATAGAGKPVTLIEMGDRLLARALPPEISSHMLSLHTANGVRIRLGAKFSHVEEEEGHVTAVHCNGERLPCDLLIVGIGAIPNIELAAESGLACDNGIATDIDGRTSDPAIYACGDCTSYPSPFTGSRVRIESVQNATDRGRVVAASIAGAARPPHAAPRFWSDQFDCKFQMIGFSALATDRVTRGDLASGRFSVFSYAGDRLVGVDSVNKPGDQMIARRLFAMNVHPDKCRISDDTYDLASFARGAATRAEVPAL
jgi:3-phenylpropionate/trans-cinnamate dioxygenase ferredoxin reductase subunit